MRRISLLALIVYAFFTANHLSAQVAPFLLHGHAHNDYTHTRPLFQALENGYTSLEIDVFLHKGKLVVSHIPVGLDHKKTIEELYLEPIKQVIKHNGGTVYKGFDTPVIFMIDFKTDGTAAYEQLKKILKKYESLITIYKHDSVIHQRAINVLISGNGPESSLLQEDSSVATLDGNIHNMADKHAAKVYTRYSSAWESYFKWTGVGAMPANQRAKLDLLVATAHETKKQIRFYHIPDKTKTWRVLLDAKVDWINTNRLVAFRNFCLKK